VFKVFDFIELALETQKKPTLKIPPSKAWRRLHLYPPARLPARPPARSPARPLDRSPARPLARSLVPAIHLQEGATILFGTGWWGAKSGGGGTHGKGREHVKWDMYA
jgi:hypothetical protein